MAQTFRKRGPVAASEQEREALDVIDRRLANLPVGGAQLIFDGGEPIDLPVSLADAIQQAVHVLALGNVLVLSPLHRQLTTHEAADLLNVSLQYLVQLLDEGAIPFVNTGTHRRVRFEDLMTYEQQRDALRRRDLDYLTQLSEELGLYDLDETCTEP